MKTKTVIKNGIIHKPIFTLIELLVVVAIIAILASILLPAMRGVREKTLQIQCMNNLHQCGLAIQMYADDYNGKVIGYVWDGVAESVWWQGVTPTYLSNTASLTCPSTAPNKFSLNPSSNKYCTYGIRFWVSRPTWEYRNQDGHSWNYLCLGKLQNNNPQDAIVLSDALNVNIASSMYLKQSWVFHYDPPTVGGAIHLRHSECANCWFADGHVVECHGNDIKQHLLKELPVNTQIFVAGPGGALR